MELILLPAILCFLRISSFVAFLPPFGGQHIPNTVKIGLAMALTCFWMPRVLTIPAPAATVQQGTTTTDASVSTEQSLAEPTLPIGGTRRWLRWTWLGAREILLGSGLAWLLGMILIPMRIAGSWLAEQIGLNMASITAGTDTGSGNVLAVLLEICGVLMLYALSIHHDFLRIFDHFFDQYQVGQPWSFPNPAWIVGIMTRLPERGLAIAAPLAVVFFLILIVLLFAMKQSPQFNLFTFGMPFRLATGLIAMVVMFPEMLSGVARHLSQFLLTPV